MFGTRLAALRKASGMNQKQLAQELSISSSAVGMYEQGRREPPMKTLMCIAQYFGVSIDFLVTGQPASEQEQAALTGLVADRIAAADQTLLSRETRPFSREELAVMVAALLMEP